MRASDHAGLISLRVALNSPARNQVWGSRPTGGRLACTQQMRVQLPPLPPSSPGRPSRLRRQSEKLDKHVRLVLLAPDVTVAEWLRRQNVDLSTRVRFPPVTPINPAHRPTGQGTASEGWDSGSNPDGPAKFSGTRKTEIRCARDAENTGFDSQVPDQSPSGVAKLGRHRTVNAATRRFESCSRSQALLAQWQSARLTSE